MHMQPTAAAHVVVNHGFVRGPLIFVTFDSHEGFTADFQFHT